MTIDLLNPIFETGLYSELLKSGLISYKVGLYRDYYLFVDKEIRANGLNKSQAVKTTALFFEVSEDTIWRALRSFN